MTGTEKQIAWAEDIKAEFNRIAAAYISDLNEFTGTKTVHSIDGMIAEAALFLK